MNTPVIDPEAAVAQFLEQGFGASSDSRELELDVALAVYRLGRSAFHAAVVRRIGDAHVVVAERTAAVGGAEFDELLLAYLSGRHRDADRRFWDRLDGADEADRRLRQTMLVKIARAREQLSGQDFTVITVPAADLKLSLTREDLESSIQDLVEETVDHTAAVLAEAGVAPQSLAGVLVAGGAARTPLALAALQGRLGVAPVAAAGDVLAGEADTDTRELLIQPAPEPEAPPRRLARPFAVFVSLIVLVGAVAAFGTQLGDHEPPSGSGSLATAPAGPETSAADAETDGGTGGEEASPTTPSPESEAVTEDEPEPAAPTTAAATTPTAEVPDVVGLSTEEAVAALADAGFADVGLEGERRGFLDFSHDDCEVIAQDPAADSDRPVTAAITVTFSHSGNEEECGA